MSTHVEVIGAYGREYQNQRSIREDWNAGKDFRDVASGRYLNKEDADKYGLKVIIRYSEFRKVVAIN